MQVVFVLTGCLNPPSRLKDIEEKLSSLGGKSVPLRYLDSAQDSKNVSGLLNDLQEAVNDYMVRSWLQHSSRCLLGQQMVQQMAIYEQGCRHIVSTPPFVSDQME